MSNKEAEGFREMPPPQLAKIFTITQPQSELIYQHWKHLITALQWELDPNTRLMCLMYKSKASVSLISFQEGCLLYQRKFKIVYGQIQEITCLKMHSVMIKFQNNKKREIITAVGFYDGALELYHLSITAKSIVFKKLLTLESNAKSPVTSIVMTRGHVFVGRLHQVEVYKDCLGVLASLIVAESANTIPIMGDPKCRSTKLPLRQIGAGTMLWISCGKNAVHVFNESEGSKSFLLETLQEYGTILDSITFMKETSDQNLIIGDTNDKLKVIYKNRKVVERYNGFKNYCSDAFTRTMQKAEQLWVADYHGAISYFQRNIETSPKLPANTSLKMNDYQIRFSTKICEQGIKKLIICNKILILLDTESNIHLFDIIRKEPDSESSEVEVEQVEEFASDA